VRVRLVPVHGLQELRVQSIAVNWHIFAWYVEIDIVASFQTCIALSQAIPLMLDRPN
jgi:hypothetical protein